MGGCEAPKNRKLEPLPTSVIRAYITPALLGGFSRACLALFTFSCGTAPMFVFIFMVRDLVGITDPVWLQVHFSSSSIMFCLLAAASALVTGLTPSGAPGRLEVREVSARRLLDDIEPWLAMFSATLLLIPISCLVDAYTNVHMLRIEVFYFFAAILGVAFGVVFARFQDGLWRLLPPDCCVANAIGFSATCRLAGIGIGNFFASMMLGIFKASCTIEAEEVQPVAAYAAHKACGYSVVCLTSAALVMLSRHLVGGVPDIIVVHELSRSGARRHSEFSRPARIGHDRP
eukprot:NODE_1378_length_1161_cov_273.343580.p1 GENE.NODE_1378_length_1161_cov_273.343580~~NODE_1378_length_1161_cov_273.343580.p1  ORF type:complete len:288 (+),score=77.72 NODE_1378_length_1161_cov_273.343580:3-866(+)